LLGIEAMIAHRECVLETVGNHQRRG
jgi:hypothetical protein